MGCIFSILSKKEMISFFEENIRKKQKILDDYIDLILVKQTYNIKVENEQTLLYYYSELSRSIDILENICNKYPKMKKYRKLDTDFLLLDVLQDCKDHISNPGTNIIENGDYYRI